MRVITVNDDISPGSGLPLPPYVIQRDAYKYDTSGNKIETIAYLINHGDPWFRETYEYDDSGRLRKRSWYERDSDKNLKLFRAVTYTYDGRGNLKEESWRDAGGTLMDRLSYTGYKHDRRGNWIERSEARFQIYDRNQPKEQWGTVYRFISYY